MKFGWRSIIRMWLTLPGHHCIVILWNVFYTYSCSVQESYRSSPSSVVSASPTSVLRGQQNDTHSLSHSIDSNTISNQPSMPLDPTILLERNQSVNIQLPGVISTGNKIFGLPAAIAASNIIATWLALLSNANIPVGPTNVPEHTVSFTGVLSLNHQSVLLLCNSLIRREQFSCARWATLLRQVS